MCDYDELDWMQFREEAYLFNKNREETLLKKWLTDICYRESIGYYRDCVDRRFEIYTTRPGVLIGKGGINIDKLKLLLFDEFKVDYKVVFVEIRGGFIQI